MRLSIPLSATRPTLPSAAWRGIAACTALAVVTIAALAAASYAPPRAVPVEAACAVLHDAAGDVLATRLRATRSDAEFRLLGEALFKLRRANRNCREGLAPAACRDYQVLLAPAALPAGARRLCASAT